MKKRCRKSGKVKFDTFDQAWKRAGEIMAKPTCPAEKNFSAYRCPSCNKIHLTSNTPKDQK